MEEISFPIDWRSISTDIPEVEKMIANYLDDFYKVYNLYLPYQIELKTEHTGSFLLIGKTKKI